jgi:hypothetical protein
MSSLGGMGAAIASHDCGPFSGKPSVSALNSHDVRTALRVFHRLGTQHTTAWRVSPMRAPHGPTKLADMSVKPIPEGYTSLTPFLCIDGASAAIDFYVSVFGA